MHASLPALFTHLHAHCVPASPPFTDHALDQQIRQTLDARFGAMNHLDEVYRQQLGEEWAKYLQEREEGMQQQEVWMSTYCFRV